MSQGGSQATFMKAKKRTSVNTVKKVKKTQNATSKEPTLPLASAKKAKVKWAKCSYVALPTEHEDAPAVKKAKPSQENIFFFAKKLHRRCVTDF